MREGAGGMQHVEFLLLHCSAKPLLLTGEAGRGPERMRCDVLLLYGNIMPQARVLAMTTTDVLGHNKECGTNAPCFHGAYVKCQVTLVFKLFLHKV